MSGRSTPSAPMVYRCIGTPGLWRGWWCSGSCISSDVEDLNGMALELSNETGQQAPDIVGLPAPTPWPIVLAFGLTLLSAGMVTSDAVSVLGAILAVAGAVGWFRDVLPHESHEPVQVARQVPVV